MKIPERISFAYVAPYPGGAYGWQDLESFVGEPCLASFSQSPSWMDSVELPFSYSMGIVNTSEGPVFFFVIQQSTIFLFVIADALDERLWSLLDLWERRGKYVSCLGMSNKANIHACSVPDMNMFGEFRIKAGKSDNKRFRKAVREVLSEDLLLRPAADILRSEGKAYAIQKISVEVNVLDLDVDGALHVVERPSATTSNSATTTSR